MRNVNWIQIVFVLVVLLGPAIGALFKSMSEKAEARKRERAKLQAREDRLRTGRPDAEAQSAPAQERLPTQDEINERIREMAERRRKQIEQMQHRQAQARSTGTSPASSGTGSQPVGIPVVVAPKPPPRRSPPTLQKVPQSQRVPAGQNVPGALYKREAKQQRGADPIAAASISLDISNPFVATQSGSTITEAGLSGSVIDDAGQGQLAPHASVDSEKLRILLSDPEQLRTSIVMMELLGEPMADREPGSRIL